VAVVGRRQGPAPERLSRGDALSSLARLLLGLEPGLGWPDFTAPGVSSHASFGVGPLYRGRFEDLSVVVLADQVSDDDLFTGRALSGDAGHRLAQFLGAAGLTRSYLILRTLPVDTLDLTQARRNSLLDQPQVRALHRELLRRVCSQNPKVRVLLAIGPGAQRLAAQVVPVGVDAIPLAKAGTSGAAASWQAALDQLATRSYPKDIANPTFQLPSGRGQLPRIDLPYGTLRWVGTFGDRAVRPTDLDLGKPSPDYLKIFAPSWVASVQAAPLTPAEKAAADQLSACVLTSDIFLQKLAKQGDSEAVGEALVAEGNESRAACHPVARGSVIVDLLVTGWFEGGTVIAELCSLWTAPQPRLLIPAGHPASPPVGWMVAAARRPRASAASAWLLAPPTRRRTHPRSTAGDDHCAGRYWE
jgi:hypothetical protein